jgi:hypothetical protein
MDRAVQSGAFYETYIGHQVDLLENVFSLLPSEAVHIWLCGDSSLDNKHWLFDPTSAKASQMHDPTFTAPALNGYEHALRAPARMVQDVSYHLNALAHEQRSTHKQPVVTINAAVEESMVRDRDGQLLDQDGFIRKHLAPQDVLVVSMGGNDVALRPTLSTILAMLMLTSAPKALIRCGWAPGQAYFDRLFGERVRRVAERIVVKTKPTLVVICMLYYLDERPGGSWADPVLSKLGYDSDPAKLQLVLSTMSERLTKQGLHIEGTRVVICPLFEALDGRDPADYSQRVEPSVRGGRKMAERIWRRIEEQGALGAEVLSNKNPVTSSITPSSI